MIADQKCHLRDMCTVFQNAEVGQLDNEEDEMDKYELAIANTIRFQKGKQPFK